MTANLQLLAGCGANDESNSREPQKLKRWVPVCGSLRGLLGDVARNKDCAHVGLPTGGVGVALQGNLLSLRHLSCSGVRRHGLSLQMRRRRGPSLAVHHLQRRDSPSLRACSRSLNEFSMSRSMPSAALISKATFHGRVTITVLALLFSEASTRRMWVSAAVRRRRSGTRSDDARCARLCCKSVRAASDSSHTWGLKVYCEKGAGTTELVIVKVRGTR